MVSELDIDRLSNELRGLGYCNLIFGRPDYTDSHAVDCKHRQELYAAQRLVGVSGKILDIGSYLDFTIAMSAFMDVTMVDVREFACDISPIKQVQCDAKDMPFDDGTFDIVTSLCTLEHLGTQAFGDEVDAYADQKMVDEVRRVLKPGGDFIFTTQINDSNPAFVLNSQRIYSLEQIHSLLRGFSLEDEKFMIKSSRVVAEYGSVEDTRGAVEGWSFYCGHWRKNGN